MSKLPRSKAVAALEAVKAQYADYLTPREVDGEQYDALYPEPKLVEDYDGPGWAIMWEEGPDDWAFLLHGGTSESDRVLYAQTSAEFGVEAKAPERPPAKMPKDVFAEPIYSFAVGLYPA